MRPTAAATPAVPSLARAFLALGDPGTAAPPARRRGRTAAALAATAVLALAAPAAGAVAALGGPDDRAATLPAKTSQAGAAGDAAPDG